MEHTFPASSPLSLLLFALQAFVEGDILKLVFCSITVMVITAGLRLNSDGRARGIVDCGDRRASCDATGGNETPKLEVGRSLVHRVD